MVILVQFKTSTVQSVQFKTSTVQSVQFKTTVRYNQYNSRQQYGTISTIQDNSTVQSVNLHNNLIFN